MLNVVTLSNDSFKKQYQYQPKTANSQGICQPKKEKTID